MTILSLPPPLLSSPLLDSLVTISDSLASPFTCLSLALSFSTKKNNKQAFIVESRCLARLHWFRFGVSLLLSSCTCGFFSMFLRFLCCFLDTGAATWERSQNLQARTFPTISISLSKELGKWVLGFSCFSYQKVAIFKPNLVAFLHASDFSTFKTKLFRESFAICQYSILMPEYVQCRVAFWHCLSLFIIA